MTNLPPGIPEHHGRYQVRYDQDGKRQVQHFTRITDAKAFKRGMDTDPDRDVLVDPRRGREKLLDHAAEWLETKGNVRARTLINIEGRVRNHILPALGDKAWRKSNPRTCAASWVNSPLRDSRRRP